MTYPLVDLTVAEVMWKRNRPFRVRLVHEGRAENGMMIERWWMLLYDGTAGGPIEIRAARLGSRPGYEVAGQQNLGGALHLAVEKLDEGYCYEPGTGRQWPPEATAESLDGPFAEIRELVRAGTDRYEAFDAEGDFVMALTQEGAEVLLETDPYRVSLR